MSDMIYPLEKQIQEQLSHSNLENAVDLSIAEVRVTKTLIIKAWPDTDDAVKAELTKLFEGNDTPNVGEWAKSERRICVCTAPGQYMLMTDNTDFEVSFDAEIAAVTDISHSRCGLMIDGPKASLLLNKGLAFPLDDDHMPVGSFTQGSIHSIGVLVFKMDQNKFALFFYSSFAISFFEWVIDSALEYGYALSDRPLSLTE